MQGRPSSYPSFTRSFNSLFFLSRTSTSHLLHHTLNTFSSVLHSISILDCHGNYSFIFNFSSIPFLFFLHSITILNLFESKRFFIIFAYIIPSHSSLSFVFLPSSTKRQPIHNPLAIPTAV
ncbi:hypothetical protein BYT27DRAFT_6425169 [Phlegmacium glaucopus]|nr:hypothetical protein BYT27DRAFT_6425169 [Phlegmacium glaucopus]